MINGLLEEKQMSGVVVPRQFMEMGRLSNIPDKDDANSQYSSLEGRSGINDCASGSPKNDIIVESMDQGKDSGRNNNNHGLDHHQEIISQQHEFQAGWVPNKVPKFISPKDEDQSPETMSMIRKARVSVRARCEATMVSLL